MTKIKDAVLELKEVRDYITRQFAGILKEREVAIINALHESVKGYLPEGFSTKIEKDLHNELCVFIYREDHPETYITVGLGSNMYFETYSWPAIFVFHFEDISYDEIDTEIKILVQDATGAINRFLDKSRRRH